MDFVQKLPSLTNQNQHHMFNQVRNLRLQQMTDYIEALNY